MAKRRDYPESVIAAFLHCYKITDICKAAGISRSTAYKLLKDSDFQKILTDRKTAMIETSVNEMRDSFSRNIKILQEVVENPQTPPQTKIYGIQVFLSQLKTWTETADILKRLDEVEQNLAETDSYKKSH